MPATAPRPSRRWFAKGPSSALRRRAHAFAYGGRGQPGHTSVLGVGEAGTVTHVLQGHVRGVHAPEELAPHRDGRNAEHAAGNRRIRLVTQCTFHFGVRDARVRIVDVELTEKLGP